MKALVTQSCPVLCNLMDYRPPGSSVRGILQARIVEWLAIPFSKGSSDPGVEFASPALQAESLPLCHQGSPKFCSSQSLRTSHFIVCTFDWKRRKFLCKFVSLFCFFPQEKSLPGVVMALVCNVFDMLYQLANLEEPR